MTKLIPPEDFVIANLDGAEYTINEDDGLVHVNSDDHARILCGLHGFRVDGSEAPVEIPLSAAPAPELISDHLKQQEEEVLKAKKATGKAPKSAPEQKGDENKKPEDDKSEDDDDDKKPETVTVEQVEEMNKVDLIDFIEERGGEVANGAKKPELLEQALKLLAESKSE